MQGLLLELRPFLYLRQCQHLEASPEHSVSQACTALPALSDSEVASLIAIASHKCITRVLERRGLPVALASLACGDVELSKGLTEHPRIPLVSFTGSEKIGKIVGGTVQSR